MIVKICGVKNLEELEIVEKYADFTGVIVKSNSKRCVSFEMAKEIISSASIPVFAVSTASSLEDWLEIISKLECDHFQVHGSLDAESFQEIKSLGVTIKAFINEYDLKKIFLYSPHYALLDSGCGSGKTHDWHLSKSVAERYKVILAGGLTPWNVDEAVRIVNPFGVDVSSGVEVNGFKDERLVSEFVRRAKHAIR